MNSHFESLDETVRRIREDCELQLQTMRDKLIAAEIEATLCKEQLAKANEARDLYMRVAERLVTQFATVEKVFADAKAMALAIPSEPAKRTELPINEMNPEGTSLVNSI